MSMESLGSRAIIGEFYKRLEQDPGLRWIMAISALINSDQAIETYRWLGMVPRMREWIGGRQAKGLRDNGLDIRNLHFEATIEILVEWLRRDKTGQAMQRIRDLSEAANTHWASLLTALIINGESQACYDGQFFFDTDHSEGASGAQSNDLSIDISALPVGTHGSVTVPSVSEMALVILQCAQQILGFKDDQGEPMSENAREFTVMTPISLWSIAAGAANNQVIDQGDTNTVATVRLDGFTFNVVGNARLTWTDKIAVFRNSDADQTSALIRQQETEVDLKVKAEGSEYEFDNDAHQYGIDAWRNVGYGFWQHACLGKMI